MSSVDYIMKSRSTVALRQQMVGDARERDPMWTDLFYRMKKIPTKYRHEQAGVVNEAVV